MNLNKLNDKDIEDNTNKKILEGYKKSIIKKEKEINKAEDSNFRYLAYSLVIATLDRTKIAKKIIKKIIFSPLSLLDIDIYDFLNKSTSKLLS